MTATHPEQDVQQYPAHFEPPHGSTWRLFFGPGLVRGAWMAGLGFLLGAGLVCVLRAWWGWDPVWNTEVVLVVGAMVVAPIFFLAGIGSFDYWLYYIVGRPTRPEDHSGHGAYSWKDYFRVNTDHKVIGIQYLVTTFVFFTVGGLMAMFFRAELAQPGLQFVDSQTFNGLVSVHATLMIFLFIIPAFAGLANFAVPLMLGAPDMAFPRLNALSFWLLPIAGIMFVASFLAPGGAFGAGWTGYAPLSEGQPLGQTFFNMGVQWAGASSIMTALNFLVTIITMRAPGMTFWRMPLLVWANFTTSLLVVLATPFIAGSQFFVMFDRIMHTNFFVPEGGGYVLGYQHIFWFYSHPAVYIMMLPGFGIVSEVISSMSRKPIFGYRLMALSLLGILVLGFSVWAHHMFVAGMADWLRVPMMITTLLIAIPTGIKVFSWIATLWRGRIHLTTPMLFALGFVTMFVIGGLSGIYLGSVPIDIAASDTYFIVAHIHYVLFGGSVFTIYAGVYYWFPKMTGRMYSEKLGKWHFWLTFVSFNATFFPMHYIGLRGMPRRVSDYDEAFGDLNLFISTASFVLGASFVLFVYNMITSWVVARSPSRIPGRRARSSGRSRRRRRSSTSTRSHRWSAGRTSTACPVHSTRSSARRSRRPPRGGARMTEAVSVLVVANETLVGDELVDSLRRRAEHGPVRAAVVAPVTPPREGYVVYRDSRRAAASRRLDRVLAWLRLAGIPAHGAVYDDDPLTAVKDVLASEEIDEIVVCTHPATRSGWLRKEPPRRDPEGGRRPSGRAHRLRRQRPLGRQRPRRGERDRTRRAAPRSDPGARRGKPRDLPHRLSAERSLAR